MRRIPWGIFFALLAGFGLGLAYSWTISPLRVVDAKPIALRTDFRDAYRSAIAAAFAATGNLSRAQARLAVLEDANPVEALNAQAQRNRATGESFQQADQLAALALALSDGISDGSVVPATSLPETAVVQSIQVTASATIPPPPPDVPILLTETQPPLDATQPVVIATTPRPTQTPLPTLGAPFRLTGEETTCDINLPDGLLQVVVLNSNRRQMPGIKVSITWDGGEEQFFTGLKPEIGNGYADYVMTPNVIYSVQLGVGSDVAAELTPSTCQTPSGETYLGGIKLTFQQP
jgi:hypothetical protein